MFPKFQKCQNSIVIRSGVLTFLQLKKVCTWKCPTTDTIFLLINNIIFFSNTRTSHTAITDGVRTYLLTPLKQLLPMSQKGNLLKTEYGNSYCWNKIKANCFRPTTAILLKTFSSIWRPPPNTQKSQNGNLLFTTTE